jgi:hypothetical protein
MGSVPMIQRNPQRAWPLLVVVGMPCGVLFATFYLVSLTGWPRTTFTGIAALVALIPLLWSGYVLALGPNRPRGAIGTLCVLAVIGVAFAADSQLQANQLPPGWPEGLPRYPGAWTGRGDVRNGQRAWFERRMAGRTSVYEVSYGAANPGVERVRGGPDDGCDTYRANAVRVRVCPSGKSEVAVTLEPSRRSPQAAANSVQ